MILGVLFLTFREPIERALPAIPAALAEPAGMSAEGQTMPVAESPREREQRAVTEFIAKRYRVADDAIARASSPPPTAPATSTGSTRSSSWR